MMLTLMEKFTQETVQHLSKLCRINCTEEEVQDLTVSIDKILSHIESLQSIDTEGIMPAYTAVVSEENVLREDLLTRVISREEFLKNSPGAIGGMIRVPKVFT